MIASLLLEDFRCNFVCRLSLYRDGSRILFSYFTVPKSSRFYCKICFFRCKKVIPSFTGERKGNQAASFLYAYKRENAMKTD